MLWSGDGTHDRWVGNQALPKGMRSAEGTDEHASMVWELDDKEAVFALLAGSVDAEGLEPVTIDDAKQWLDWSKWEEAINAELKSLDDAHTWNVVEHSQNTNVASCKWVFKIKKNPVGEIDKYKAWLVGHGFTQQYGVDYNETYTPVARLALLCLIMAITAHWNWNIDVFNFHSAFLNGKLDEDEVIFMELPPGFDKKGCDLVARLCVTIYGSKQGALKWYHQLCSTLHDLGFKWMEADWEVFITMIAYHILILASHIDDCTVTGSSSTLIKVFKEEIGMCFRITDLGPISWLLGMKVTCNQKAHTISLFQESYINMILTKYNFTDAKPVTIPLDPHIQLSESQSSGKPSHG